MVGLQKECQVDTQEFFNRKSLRKALKAWHRTAILGKHPLAGLTIVAQRRTSEGRSYADTPAGRGVALRHLLYDAIDKLKPESHTADYNNPQWRYYTILYQQYVKEMRAKELSEMLGLSDSGYFKDQRRALERLGQQLEQWERESTRSIAPQIQQPAVRSNLPMQPTAFIGRKQELAHAQQLLINPDCRLLTINGSGGIGKTRLALELARRTEGAFADGAVFVPLAPLNNIELLPTAIAEAIGFTISSNQSVMTQLINFLQTKSLLLLLDNFEHLVESNNPIAMLLEALPNVKMLITTREPLHLRGEWTLTLQGMQFPAVDAPATAQYDALDLFYSAVQRVAPNMQFSAEDQGQIVRLCRLVGGTPLALELAASWVPHLSCYEIANEIERNIDFLESSLHDVPARHRSLRGVFDHSWELLTPTEQAVFRKLAVFTGAFSRESAQAVTGATLFQLRALHEKSLLRFDDAGGYKLQKLLWQYAAEKLAAHPTDSYATHQAHSRYFLELLQTRGAHLRGGKEQMRSLRAIREHLSEIRAAWVWAEGQNDRAQLLKSAELLHLSYYMLNRWREGAALLANCDDPFVCGLYAHIRYRLGDKIDAHKLLIESLATLQNDPQREREFALIQLYAISADLEHPVWTDEKLYEQSLAYFTRTRALWGQAWAHYAYAAALHYDGLPKYKPRIEPLMLRALALRETIDDGWGIPHCLDYLGHIAYERGEYEAAGHYAHASLESYEAREDRVGIANALTLLGQVAGTRNDLITATRYYEDVLAIRRDLGNLKDIAESLDSLGFILFTCGDYKTARTYYDESLELSQQIDDQPGIAWSLHNLGDIARVEGKLTLAETLYTESAALHTPQSWGHAVAIDKLGQLAMQTGKPDSALTQFLQGLELALAVGRVREATDVLFQIVRLLAEQHPALPTIETSALAGLLDVLIEGRGSAEKTRIAAQKLRAELTIAEPTPFDSLESAAAFLTTLRNA